MRGRKIDGIWHSRAFGVLAGVLRWDGAIYALFCDLFTITAALRGRYLKGLQPAGFWRSNSLKIVLAYGTADRYLGRPFTGTVVAGSAATVFTRVLDRRWKCGYIGNACEGIESYGWFFRSSQNSKFDDVIFVV